MTRESKIVLAILGGGALLFLSGQKKVVERAADFLIPWEGFRASPYWDVKQWSIGYGTGIGYNRSSKPNVVVDEEDAYEMLINRLEADKQDILSRLNTSIGDSLMTALLSFNYNLGIGNTVNIINRINAGRSMGEIAEAMKMYVYVDGVPNDTLIDRRNAEARLFSV